MVSDHDQYWFLPSPGIYGEKNHSSASPPDNEMSNCGFFFAVNLDKKLMLIRSDSSRLGGDFLLPQ